MDEPASGSVGGSARGDTRRLVLSAAAVLVLVVVVWGGYSHTWPWTGISGSTATLWDWLHLLLLPLAFAVLPVWFRSDTRVGRRTKGRGATALAVFVLLVILGYTIPWAWTGFRGNTVWDWLELLVLPLAVALAPRVAEVRRGWGARHTTVALGGLAAFVGLVIGGYVGHWSWTGFTGNTLWNWLNLLFLPLLVPTVVVPALRPKVMGEVIYLDADGKPIKVEIVEGTAAQVAASEAAAVRTAQGDAAAVAAAEQSAG
jgi:uncharacterized membrane protein